MSLPPVQYVTLKLLWIQNGHLTVSRTYLLSLGENKARSLRTDRKKKKDDILAKQLHLAVGGGVGNRICPGYLWE